MVEKVFEWKQTEFEVSKLMQRLVKVELEAGDRKSDVKGKSVFAGVHLGGRRIITKMKHSSI